MISKPVWRDPYYEDGMEIYNVEETFDVYDRASALVLDHLLHHIQGLNTLATHNPLWIARHYGLDEPSDAVQQIVLKQCHELLEYHQRMITSHSDLTRAHLLADVQARIPFLDPTKDEPTW